MLLKGRCGRERIDTEGQMWTEGKGNQVNPRLGFWL